jgi:predicted nicotinamide N-methyase
MFSLESFNQKYETETNEVVVKDRKFQILLPRFLTGFINPQDVFHEFPLWAKIWRASWVLADYLAAMPVAAKRKFLELGAGVGLVSIVAASFGHRMTMSEYNHDALQFACANALINDCPKLPVVELDWNRPQLPGRFDYIVASEVIYKEEDCRPLVNLLKACLKPNGEVFLAGEMRKSSMDFYKELANLFNIKVQKKVLRSDDEEIGIYLFRMTLKRNRPRY